MEHLGLETFIFDLDKRWQSMFPEIDAVRQLGLLGFVKMSTFA